MWRQKRIELIEHNPAAHADRALFQIEIRNPSIEPRELYNQPLANRASGQPTPGPARNHRDVRVRRRTNYRTGLGGVTRKCDCQRFNLVDGRIRGVKLTREVVEANLAIGAAQSSLDI